VSVAPATACGFAKGKPFSQTRWTFSESPKSGRLPKVLPKKRSEARGDNGFAGVAKALVTDFRRDPVRCPLTPSAR